MDRWTEKLTTDGNFHIEFLYGISVEAKESFFIHVREYNFRFLLSNI